MIFKVVTLIPVQMSHGIIHCIEACAVNTARSLLHLGNLLATSFRARGSIFMYKNPFEHSYLLTRLTSLQLLKAPQVVKTFKTA